MSKKRKTGSIPVRCIETGKTYQSTKEAADDIGCSSPLISLHLKGKLKHAKHFHFEYAMPDFKLLENESSEVRDVVGYEGLYKVSRTGVIYNAKTGFEVMQSQQNSGYLMVGMRDKGKQRNFTVHRIVATAFIENPDNLPQVNHKDENKMNNCVDNLEWCSAAYNVNYGDAIAKRIRNRKDRKPVMCIETGVVYDSAPHAERETGISAMSIRWCAIGAHKTAGKLHWKYV